MCIHQRKIVNKYTGKDLFVSCGHCPACLQRKAALRANRIRMAYKTGYLCFFVTLTYDNYFVPYVKRCELNLSKIPIYRDYDFRMVGKGQSEFVRVPRLNGQPIGFIDNPSLRDFRKFSYKHLVGRSKDCIGVCFYPDVQKFLKKLRINYERKFNKRLDVRYFACSEYGGHSQRPHFHLLIYVPTCLEGWIRTAVSEAWTYGNRVPTGRYVEIARDAAGYVASYVNSCSGLSDFYALSEVRQKHSYSKGFGTDVDFFSLPSLLQKIRGGNLEYSKEARVGGQLVHVDLLVPSYVINRYFPRFKGFSRIDPSELSSIIVHSGRLCEYRRDIDYTDEDIRSIKVRLKHCIQKFVNETGLTSYDYSYYYAAVWRLYSSCLLRRSLVSEDDWSEHYVNNLDIVTGFVSADFGSLVKSKDDFVLDVNMFKKVVRQTADLTDLYFRMSKQKDVVNTVMSAQGVMV